MTIRAMNALLALIAVLLLSCLSACGGGGTTTPPPGGGNNNGGGGGNNGGGLTIPPVETFQDMSPASDDNVTSWLKDAYHTLPEVGDADGPYQNSSLMAYADSVFGITNNERATAGKPALMRSTDLDNLAQAHARDMALRDYFSHDTEGYGIDYVGRLDAIDPAPYNFMGENIAGNQQTPQAVMSTWMNSDGHRANILHDNYEYVGIGCYYDAGGGPYNIYWVQVFARFNGDPDAHVWLLP
ncbi:MAG: CAP domain-containing protein [Planctomycetales bacterium]|nr:CAP domain-containing protein [bacterium]UNM09232.1 MAG: CAP domain-containing protein [Planctomycetales bacterium]